MTSPEGLVRALGEIPPVAALLREHREFYEETLMYVFLGEVARWLVGVAEGTVDDAAGAAADVYAALEEAYVTGDRDTRGLLSVGFLENLPVYEEGHPVWQGMGPRMRVAPRGLADRRGPFWALEEYE